MELPSILSNIKVNMSYLISNICFNNQIAIMFCLNNHLMANSRNCESCSHYCIKIKENNTDEIIWRCSNRHCLKKMSIRAFSIFSGSKVKVEIILKLAYCFWRGFSQKDAKYELGINSKNFTLTRDWYIKFRYVCTQVLRSQNQVIGGPGTIVELDEAKFGKRKYHRGARVEGQWVFGGVQRRESENEPFKCFVVCVDKRDSRTLMSYIERYVASGTTIITDGWSGYNSLANSAVGYLHQVVNHSLYFKDPITGAHTNTIEGTWMHLKKSLPKHGTVKSNYDSYFLEWLYRKKFNDQTFGNFLEHIRIVYNSYNNNIINHVAQIDDIWLEI